MALGARNRAAEANRPKPAPTKLDKLKEAIKQQYAVHKAPEAPPAPEPAPAPSAESPKQ